MKAFISYESGVRHVHEALFSAADGWIDEAYASMDAIEEASSILSETEPKDTLEEHKRTCNPRTCWIGQDGTSALAESLARFLEDC